MLTSVSDSASPLHQTWLSHPPWPHLPLCWHDSPASEGTSFPARCAQALQNPTSWIPLRLGRQRSSCLLPAGQHVQLCPWHLPLVHEKEREGNGEGAGPAEVSDPQHLRWLRSSSTSQVLSGGAGSAQHASGLPSTLSHQGGKPSPNVVSQPAVVLFRSCYRKLHETEKLYIGKLCCFPVISPNSYHSLFGHSTNHCPHPSLAHHAAGKWDEAER